ncbi:MAG: transglycosylase domain-containing protein [Firmicutes bacterium]|nr:transglycosylase domain-containing protein [Bacillota bacterium]
MAGSVPSSKKRKLNTKMKSRNAVKKGKNGRKQHSKPFTVILLLFLMIIIVGVFAVGGALIGGYIAIIRSIPDFGIAGIQPNTYTTVIYNNKGVELSRLHGEENREYATLENIPLNMQNAVVAIEDERFYEHDGVDMRGLTRAVVSTLSHKQLQGGSTITQQLIKNNVTKKVRNDLKSKIKEQYLALKYEKELTQQLGSKKAAKDYIMELYLNTISFGHGYNGVQVAARGYFGKDAKDLDLAQCACLAGITNNPSLYSPRLHPDKNKERQSIILNYMLVQGYITQEEYDQAIDEDIYTNIGQGDAITTYADGTSSVAIIHSYYEDALVDQISEDLQSEYNMTSKQANNIIYNGGLQIYSNFDPRIQKIVDTEFNDPNNFPTPIYGVDVDYLISIADTEGEQINSEYKQYVKNQVEGQTWVAQKRAEIEASLTPTQSILAENVTYNIQPQASMAIIDYHTGEVKAIGGGRGKKLVNRGFNRATDSTRQPGSVFKILAAYAPAIDTGKMNAATQLVDEPYSTRDGYTPKNWWGNSYRGAVNPRTAIMDSMNVVAVKTMVATGVDSCHDYLTNMGFTTIGEDHHASTALGGLTYGVTQLELAAAYGTIANNGVYYRPMFYSKVLDHDGNVLLQSNREPLQVIKPTTSYQLTSLMQSVITDGTGKAAKFTSSNMPLAGKTGTTTDSKDLTFVGYTPYYVASIWYGFDRYDNQKVKNMEGFDSTVHMKVWKKIMEQVNEGSPVIDFPVPEGLKKVKICRYTGMLASGTCPAVEEWMQESDKIYDTCNMNHSVISNIYANQPGSYTLYNDVTTINPVVPVQKPATGNTGRNNTGGNTNNYRSNNSNDNTGSTASDTSSQYSDDTSYDSDYTDYSSDDTDYSDTSDYSQDSYDTSSDSSSDSSADYSYDSGSSSDDGGASDYPASDTVEE